MFGDGGEKRGRDRPARPTPAERSRGPGSHGHCTRASPCRVPLASFWRAYPHASACAIQNLCRQNGTPAVVRFTSSSLSRYIGVLYFPVYWRTIFYCVYKSINIKIKVNHHGLPGGVWEAHPRRVPARRAGRVPVGLGVLLLQAEEGQG